MNSLIEYFLKRSIFVNLLTFVMIIAGGYAALTTNREAFPKIDFDLVVVTVVYPGASPREVEKLVTNRLEESIKEVDGIKEYRSTSIENRSAVSITIDPDAEDPSRVVDDIRSAVERTEDLPEDAKKPIILEITSGNQPIIEVHMASRLNESGKDVLTYTELRNKAELLERSLLDLKSVARIERNGWRDAEVHINVDPLRLQSNYLSIDQIIAAVRNRNINFPGGDIKRGERELIVRTVGEFDKTAEISEAFIRSNDIGRGLRIRDVAEVRDGFADEEIQQRSRGNLAITLTVLKKANSDAISMVNEVKGVVEDYQKIHGQNLEIEYANDLSYFVRRRLGVLMNNGITGLILVITSLFFFLGWRTSLMVALGLPIAMGITFIVIGYYGVTLNLISMFGLILVVGILVDDAIIVSENFYRHLEEGKSTMEAAFEGTKEVASPLIATVTTSIAAFAPLMFMSGIMGKFIIFIPMVVIIALLASLFESFFILPSHLHDINKYSSEKFSEIKHESTWFANFRKNSYEPLLALALKHKPWVMTGITVVLIIAGAVQVKFGRFVLFPDVIETFHIKVTAPSGSTLEHTEKYIEYIEKEIKKLSKEELDIYTAQVGIIRKNPNDPFVRRGDNYAQLMVFLTPEGERKRMAGAIIREIRNKTLWMLNENSLKKIRAREGASFFTESPSKNKSSNSEEKNNPEQAGNPYEGFIIPPEYADLKGKLDSLEFEKLQGGPPVGKPVAVEITGDDFKTLLKIADEYKKIMGTAKGIVDIDDDYDDGKDELKLRINENLAAQAGVSVAQIAIAVNAALQGNIATTIKRPNEEVDVRVRFQEKFRQSMDSLNKITVVNRMGNLIPISRLINFERSRGLTLINHRDGRRLITVTANVVEKFPDGSKGLTSQEANKEIAKKAGNLPKKYPGYNVVYSGENKDTKESLASLGRSFLVAIVIIFMILASLFKSLLQPFVVLGAVPFALVGVITAFLLHGMPFSFMAMMGMIGLSGVVVNDSIVLVDFTNRIREENPEMSMNDAVLTAASMRLRAVMLTSITTVLGLLPTAYGIGGNDPFLVPMALAFSWGLLFSTILTLIIVPVQYHIVESSKIWVRKKLNLVEH